MDTKKYAVVEKVVERASLTKAAGELGLTQSGVSHAIGSLEEELGVQLFYAFNREQHLTDEGLYALKDGTLDDLGALEAAEHLTFCDYCLLRYTKMIDNAPECLQQPMRDLIPQVQNLMRLRSFRIMTNRYVSTAAAVALAFLLWNVTTFGITGSTGVPVARPTPTEPQPSFRQRVNSVVGGFYESLNNTFKNFTLTAESGLEQLKTEPIGGGTAKGE